MMKTCTVSNNTVEWVCGWSLSYGDAHRFVMVCCIAPGGWVFTWASRRMEDFGQSRWMSACECRYSEGVRGGACLWDTAGRTEGLDTGSGDDRDRRVKSGAWQGVLERNVRCNEGTAHPIRFRMSWDKWWWSWRGTDRNRRSKSGCEVIWVELRGSWPKKKKFP